MASCHLPSSSSASSLPITSNPEDGPSAPSATVTKKRKNYDKTFKLKVIMFAEKFSNREAERNRPRPRIERLPATHLKLIERARSNRGNTVVLLSGLNQTYAVRYKEIHLYIHKDSIVAINSTNTSIFVCNSAFLIITL